MTARRSFSDLPTLAAHLRQVLEEKKTILLYAYNGIGKTRLSMAFKDVGKQGQGDEAARDTLYFNAFTEDLFHWDNDLDADNDRRLTLNAQSRFFAGLAELEMDNRIRPLLPVEPRAVVTVGPLQLDVEQHMARLGNKQARLTPRLVILLRAMMERPGEVINRKELFSQVWDTNYTADTRTLDVHMSWLRDALEEDPRHPVYIKTVRGVGYRLDLNVSR